MNAVEFERVSKSYAIYDSPSGRLAELATFGIAKRHREFHALSDVTFSVGRGEVFCIIGENGSGKSTTLQTIAGILAPTSGEVRVNGRVSALLDLGSGFNPEFTGRENIYMNGAILGFSNKELDRIYSSIEAFAEIGDFINEPVRTYSSGMAVRLAFSVAIHVEPEILIVDEALAVGDAWFRQRCMRRINEMKDRDVTIIFVSHSAADVRAIGNRVMWLDKGRVQMIGETNEVIAKYLACVAGGDAAVAEAARPQRAAFTRVETIPNVDHRSGDGGAEILGIAVLDGFGDPLHLMIPQSRILVRITARAHRGLSSPDIGVRLRNHLGLDFASTSAQREGHAPGAMSSGELVTADFQFEIPELYPGAFSFSPWVSDGTICDFVDNAITVQMARGEGPVYGYVQAPCRIEVQHGEPRIV